MIGAQIATIITGTDPLHTVATSAACGQDADPCCLVDRLSVQPVDNNFQDRSRILIKIVIHRTLQRRAKAMVG